MLTMLTERAEVLWAETFLIEEPYTVGTEGVRLFA